MDIDVVLASASPRRQELLRYIFSEFSVVPSNEDETFDKNDSIIPQKRPEYLAVKKGKSVSLLYPHSLCIGCDTSVFIGNELLGKPRDKEDAENMLRMLSGNTHKVITGCAVFYKGKHISFSEESFVTFYELSKDEIEAYLKMDEYKDKAGSYAIQGYGMNFVKSINGNYQNIVGLPVSRLKREIDNILK